MDKKQVFDFNINYREAIENGKMTLTTKRGNAKVTVLRWDLNDPLKKRMLAILSYPLGYEYVMTYYEDGRASLSEVTDDDLMVIPIMPNAKFKVGDEIVSKHNSEVKYEVLKVGTLNELGLYCYELKLLSQCDSNGEVRLIDIETVDSWGLLVEKPSRLENAIANIIRRNFTIKIEDAYNIAKSGKDEIIDIVTNDYCNNKMTFPENYLSGRGSDFEFEVAKLMSRCHNSEEVKSAEEEASNLLKYLDKEEGCGHIKGTAITGWKHTAGNTIPEDSLVRLPSGEIKIYPDNVKFKKYGVDYIPLSDLFTLPRI